MTARQPAGQPGRLLMPPRPLSGTLVAVEAEIGPEPAEAVALARDEVLGWLADARGAALPEAAWDGAAFHLDRDGAVLDVVAAIAPPAWLCRLREPAGGTGGESLLDIAVLAEDGRAMLLAQSAWTAAQAAATPAPALPEPIRRIASRVGLMADGRRLLPVAWRLRDAADLDALLALLDSPARRLPVAVLSENAPEGGGTLVEPDAAATALLGLAHVAAIPYALAQELTRRAGKEWSVFGGAARLYRAGLDRYAGAYRRHPLLLPATFPGASGPADALEALLRLAAAASLAGGAVRVALAELRARLTGSGLPGRLARAASDGERIALLEAEVRRLRQRIEEARGLAAIHEAQLRALDDSAEASALEAQALRARLHSIAGKLRVAGGMEELQDDQGDARRRPDQFAGRYAGQIEFSAAARAALASELDGNRLRNCLDTLANDHGRADLPAILRKFGAECRDGLTVLREAGATGGPLAVTHVWDPAAETLVVTDIRPV